MNTYRITGRGFEFRLEATDAESALYYAEALYPNQAITVWAVGFEEAH